MKVVLFCGGFGRRLYPYTENIPKPLIYIGNKPIIWHLMKYYSYFGHKDFILCLGYRANQIKKYFTRLRMKDWRITFIDTGLYSNVGQRLKAVANYLDGQRMFLANYSDVLTDLHLPLLIDFFVNNKKICCFLSVKPYQSFHILSIKENSLLEKILRVDQSDIKINGGFFVFKKDIFRYIYEEEDLIDEPFQRLIKKQEIMAYKYNGFWACMDTFKQKEQLDDMYYSGRAPWEVWEYPQNVVNKDGT